MHLLLYQGNKVLKSLFIYYERASIPGTYMMDEREGNPYMVGLTGYRGDNLENLFNMEETSWRIMSYLAMTPVILLPFRLNIRSSRAVFSNNYRS